MNRPTRNTIYGMLICFALMPFYACSKLRAEERAFQFVTLDCLFLGQYGTAEQTGKMVASVPKDTLAITISNFDYEKHTAVMVGNAGTDEVSFWPSFKKAVLIQFSQSGNGYLTSVSEPVGGKAIAFHSRHTWMIGQPIISEYQADCKVRK